MPSDLSPTKSPVLFSHWPSWLFALVVEAGLFVVVVVALTAGGGG